jgi:hypothetical protein
MTKINENKKRTVSTVSAHIRVTQKKPKKSWAEQIDDKMMRNAKKIDKSLGI